MRILCGTDFSEQASAAGEAAAAIARRLGDTIALVHVVDAHYPELPPTALGFAAAARSAAEDALAAAARKLGGHGVPIETYVLDGEAPVALANAARRANARMIVLAIHGRHDASRFFLGSVAERTVQLADRPVLIFRGDPGAFAAWGRGERPLGLAVGVDADEPIEPLLEAVSPFCGVARCDATFVQVIPAAGTSGEVARALDERLRKKLASLPGSGVSLRMFPNMTTLADSLRLFARVHALDLLVIGTQQRQGWLLLRESAVSRALLRDSHCSLLCIPLRLANETAEERIPSLRSVLVTTDFSELANHAIPYAYALARAEAGVVILCHVHELTSHNSGSEPLPPDSRALLEGRLRELAPREAEQHGISTHAVVVDGRGIADTIVATANELGVDAICMSAHGSVPEQVQRSAKRPSS